MRHLAITALLAYLLAACASRTEPLKETGDRDEDKISVLFNEDARFADEIVAGGHSFRPFRVNNKGYREFTRLDDGAEIVLVPGGWYHKRGYWDVPGTQMTDKRSWEYLPAMLYDKCEVTNWQVVKFLDQAKGATFGAGKVTGPDGKLWAIDHQWGLRITPKQIDVQSDMYNYPAVGITGWLALAYAKWVGGDLPTGDEFEKAAGGPSGLLFPWGDEDMLPDSTRANSYLHGPRCTMPVGCYFNGASPYGLLDMAGNVYERAYWNGIASADPEDTERLPTMIKGGGWVSPNWSNLRCVDRCAQAMDTAEGSVGFRVVVRDPEVLKHFVTEKPKLRIFTDTREAYDEAAARNVPIFLYMGYERCGQCDRIQAELFTDPEFVKYCNENLVVLIGHSRREFNDMPKTPLAEDGTFFAHYGASLADMEQVFDDFSVWRSARYVPLPDTLCLFIISPGLFVLNPHRKLIRNPDDAVLIGEDAFIGHKGGGDRDYFIDLLKQAQGKLGIGLTLAQLEAEAEETETIWKPTPEDEALWEKTRKSMKEFVKALNDYALEHDGVYPESLDAIRNYFRREVLQQDPFLGDYFRYETTDEGFKLSCYGRGDKPGGDDIPDRDIIATEEGLTD